MPTRPVQAGSSGTWGTELNAWLDVAHNSDGTVGAGQTGATAATRFVGATTSGAPVTGTFVAGDFVLDKTGLVWICTASGSPGTWKVVGRSLDDITRAGLGITSWNIDPGLAASASALTSQTIYALGVPYRQGQVVTNIGFSLTVAASGAAPTGIFVGLCSATTMLMDSANLAASSAWTTAGQRAAALTSPYTILADGLYYHLILLNGTFATTNPQFARTTTLFSPQFGSTFLYGSAGTGQTALPAVAAAVTLATAGSPLRFSTYST